MQYVEKKSGEVNKGTIVEKKKRGKKLAAQRNAPSAPDHSQSKTWQVVFYILDNILFTI